MKLYNLTAGTNPRRTRIYLAEKSVEVPMVEIDIIAGEHQQPDYLAINPLGKMPALELDDGTIITESVAICRYFECLRPNPPMFGRNDVEIGLVDMWNRRMEMELGDRIGHAFRHTNEFWKDRMKQFPDFGEHCRSQAFELMVWLDGHLENREFIATDDYTIADISAQCVLLIGKNTGTAIPEKLSNLTRWFADVTSRPTARA